ncbi:MAG TPA: cytochrome c oxidase subunit II [Acidimicrobiales bacterium]|nr:cytochrome c oxidase subunit II [Acidimicrobiales bacterium]
MHRFRSAVGTVRVRRAGLLALLGLLVAGCGGRDTRPQTTFDAEGPAADTILGLTNLTLIMAAVVFVLVEFGVLWVAWRFRARKDDDPEALPEQLHGNTKLEIGWTALPAVVLAFLAVFTVSAVLDLAEDPGEEATRIRVVGNQWWWSYDYDIDGDGVYADDDVNQRGIEKPEEYETDIEVANEMVIPAGRPVYLEIESRDVIHSFWIPALNGKKDAVPGRTHYLSMEADEPGTFIGQCTEYCGLSHAYMRMVVHALPPAEYDAWVQDQLAPAAEPETPEEAAGLEVFQGRCATCHLVEGVNGEDFDGAAQVSGAAPNLTHFASRGSFAGSIFQQWRDADGSEAVEWDEIGGELNRNQLEAWLRNPPGEKYMAPDDERGMPNLGLSEAEIDSLVAYLTSLD